MHLANPRAINASRYIANLKTYIRYFYCKNQVLQAYSLCMICYIPDSFTFLASCNDLGWHECNRKGKCYILLLGYKNQVIEKIDAVG